MALDWSSAGIVGARLLVVNAFDPVIATAWAIGLLALVVLAVIGRTLVTVAAGQDETDSADALSRALSVGLVATTAWWAALRSGGASSFTPVAIAFAGILLGGLTQFIQQRRWREVRLRWPRTLRAALVVSGAAILAIGIAYRMTLAVASSPAGQPIDFLDPAYYAVLGRELARTGVENVFAPAGVPLVGVSPQTWYHWGEIWLGSLIGSSTGLEPMVAQHLVALPVVLVSTALVTATFVRRFTGREGRGPWILGFTSCLVLSPLPLLTDVYFGSYASGLLFAITTYGVGALIAVRVLDDATILGIHGRPGWLRSGLIGVTAAALLPAHIVIAALGLIGLAFAAGAWLLLAHPSRNVVRSLVNAWARPVGVATALICLTAIWGLATGHGVGGSAPSTLVRPFNQEWARSILSTAAGSGVMLALPLSAVLIRNDSPGRSATYVASVAMLVVGALAWGALLPDYNTFHLFFGGLATIATPLAAAAIVDLWRWLRVHRYRLVAAVVVAATLGQLGLATAFTVAHLGRFAPFDYPPIPIAMLERIQQLPASAKIAYRCALDEQSVWLPRLISVNARTGRPLIPMCFQADLASRLIGADVDPDVENPSFRVAPQRQLYPSRSAAPSRSEVRSFLSRYGIRFILADPIRPNSLDRAAHVIFRAGGYTLSEVEG